jgi:hypothetical protein
VCIHDDALVFLEPRAEDDVRGFPSRHPAG